MTICVKFEFVVVRGQENIARLVSPVAQNTKNIQQTGLNAAAGVMDKDEHAMFTDALPKAATYAYAEQLPLFCRFSGKRIILCVNLPTKVRSTISLRRGLPLKNMLLAATAEGLACAFRIPIGNEPEHVKQLVKAPDGYEFTCYLAIGYPAENAHICKQKEIRIEDRIHDNRW